MALLETHQGPWMCIGDFNYVINEEKVLGGRKGCSLATNYLKELMVEFGAIDLGFLEANSPEQKVDGEMPQLKEG